MGKHLETFGNMGKHKKTGKHNETWGNMGKNRGENIKNAFVFLKDFECKNVKMFSALRAESFVFLNDFEGKNVNNSPRFARKPFFPNNFEVKHVTKLSALRA